MKQLNTIMLVVVFSLLVSACGGGGGTTASVDTTTPVDQQTVQQKVNLSWSPPSTRTDGSPLSLSELVGYRVYYGSAPTEMSLQEELIGVSETSTSFENLAPGLYYFAVTAYDADGLESGFSQIVSKQII